MSWGRGFFRLWVVFTILWIGAGLMMADRSMWSRYQTAERQLALVEEQLEVRQSAALDKRSAGADQVDIDRADILVAVGERQRRDLQRQIGRLRNRMEGLAGALFAPPVILFVLGGSLLWAFRGFRSTER